MEIEHHMSPRTCELEVQWNTTSPEPRYGRAARSAGSPHVDVAGADDLGVDDLAGEQLEVAAGRCREAWTVSASRSRAWILPEAGVDVRSVADSAGEVDAAGAGLAHIDGRGGQLLDRDQARTELMDDVSVQLVGRAGGADSLAGAAVVDGAGARRRPRRGSRRAGAAGSSPASTMRSTPSSTWSVDAAEEVGVAQHAHAVGLADGDLDVERRWR